MRLIAFGAYSLFLLIATVFIVFFRSPTGELIASRDLAKNHPLQAGDIALRIVEGQYVTKDLKMGATVLPTDLAPYPEIRPVKGRVPIAVEVEQSAVTGRTIDAGTSVLICPLAIPASIDAVVCGAEAEPCIAVAAVPSVRAADVRGKSGLTLRAGQTCE